MSWIQQAMDTFASLVAPEADPVSIREQILQGFGPEQHQQMQEEFTPKPQPIEAQPTTEEPAFEPIQVEDVPEWNQQTPEDELYPEGDAMIPIEFDKSLKYADEAAEQKLIDQMEGKEPIVGSDEQTAMSNMLDFLKQAENPDEMGLEQTPEGEVFKVFDVPNSPIGEKNIGYGIMIKDGWLTDNKAKWPVLNGAPLDIRNGITRSQANDLLKQELEKAKKSASRAAGWSKMLPAEQNFWIDLTYNGGPQAIKKSPKAMAASREGYTAEAMIKSLDYIKSGGKSIKGLFKRRITAYNRAAKEIPGVPIIEEATWGKQAKVKFAHQVKSTKVSKAFTKKFNATGDGWWKVASTTGVQGDEKLTIE